LTRDAEAAMCGLLGFLAHPAGCVGFPGRRAVPSPRGPGSFASNPLRVLSTGKCERKSKRPSPSHGHTGVLGIVSNPLLDNQPNLLQLGSERRAKGTLCGLHDIRVLHAIKQTSQLTSTDSIR